MPPPPIVALEIGTSKIVALVGEMRDDGRLIITGLGKHASKGVRKGEVVDLESAAICVRGALREAEESGQVTIREVHVALTGGHIQSQVNRGTVRVMAADREISDDDIEQVMELARAINLPSEREIVHTICQHFCIDEQKYVTNPEGLSGSKLSLDMLAMHGVRNRLYNTIKVVQKVPMDVCDVAFGGLCAALAVLMPGQKDAGALVIDLGGGTTDYVAYADRTLAEAGVLGVGGDHITNDIALGFNISPRQAEFLKCEYGSALDNAGSHSGRIDLPPEVGFSDKSVSVASLNAVINARAEEMFVMIRNRLDESGIHHQLGAGVVLTGGGAYLRDIVELAQDVFGLPCTIGRAGEVDGLAAATSGQEYAVPIGMVRYGFTSSGGGKKGGLGIFKRLFGMGR